jgi:amino acid adenylation domain-containing protein
MTGVHERFAAQVAAAPDAMAVSCGDVHLTYRMLDERANQLAYRLIDLGVGPEVPVAVAVRRSADVVVAFLAILKAGGCYLPLHQAFPLERKQWIMDHAGGPVLLADLATARGELPAGGPLLLVDADHQTPVTDPKAVVHPDQLAYVMHTSGSTGHPKGVAISHRDVLALALDPCWDNGWHERVLAVAPYAFSVSTYEVWVPLLHGGHVIVVPPGDLDVETIRRLIVSERITALHLTAGLFRVIAEMAPDCFKDVREVLTGGDVVAPMAVRRVLEASPETVVRATYGATEATLFTMSTTMAAPFEEPSSVPIGLPLDDVKPYILDERLGPVADGEAGELYVAGGRLARGYFGRADLTAERFVANPFDGTGQRMYRMGDMVRRDAGGLIEFLGRANDQVKILGFRVEPAEVEAALSKYPGLADVIAVAREVEPGDKRLTAYLVPESGAGEISVADVRAHALKLLPPYMVPAAFVVLDRLPLTPNGKLDRAALPDPGPGSESTYRAPRDSREEILCSLFAEVLGVARVGIDDSFFDLGVQSLLAMRLVSRIRSLLGTDLEISALFEAPSVAALAAEIQTMTPAPVPDGQTGGQP